LNINYDSTSKKIETVGVLIDESYFTEKKLLVQSLLENHFKIQNIKILLFKNVVKKTEQSEFPVFSYKDLRWNGTFEKLEITDFIAQKFDLLINYYDTEKMPLSSVSAQSNAIFKVGFSSVDKRLNHFMINTPAENYEIFIAELFKYLKILNKI
jgi:hypothetical protein